MSELHVGRSWTGHPLEDACPCPKAPCGLVIHGQALDACPEHAMGAFKTMRQGHPSDSCPMAVRERVAMALQAAEADCLERGEVMGYSVFADAAIAAHLEALKADGYTIVRPVTAEEEAANDW